MPFTIAMKEVSGRIGHLCGRETGREGREGNGGGDWAMGGQSCWVCPCPACRLGEAKT